MSYDFYEEFDPKTGFTYIGDGPNCEYCLEQQELLEAAGKLVISRCSTCCNNDY